MMRRKFVSVATLLIISLYLMMATIGASFFDMTFNDYAPISNKDRILRVSNIVASKDGKFVKRGGMSLHFFDSYIKRMLTPERIAIFSRGTFSLIQNNHRHFKKIHFINHEYWNVFGFNFFEGGPFVASDIDEGQKVIIITNAFRDEYFGRENVLGESLEIYGESYRIKGVVNQADGFSTMDTDVYIPYTLDPRLFKTPQIMGGYEALLMGSSVDQLPAMKQEFYQKISQVIYPNPDQVDGIESHAFTFSENFLYYNIGPDTEENFFISFFILIVMFGIPASSLLTINVSKMMERAAEIGVRKSFGANVHHLMSQFIVENLVFTFFGGILGYFFAVIMSDWVVRPLFSEFNSTFPGGLFLLNPRMFIVSMCICTIYGLATGIIPALKMAKMNPIEALKS